MNNSITDIEVLFNMYFVGNNFTAVLFKETLFQSGAFFKFVNRVNFTYDSDTFNTSLSRFTSAYKKNGHFFITSNKPKENKIRINNGFDSTNLNAAIEKHNEVVKYVPSYIFDEDGMWCIYFDNEADIFVVWCSDSLIEMFCNEFLNKEHEFYQEKNDSLFLDIVAIRLADHFRLQAEELKNTIKSLNPFLFVQ